MPNAWLLLVPAILSGALLVRWALCGDRARSRRRCPRCWYDMRGIGLRCPECGYTAPDEKHLFATRRRRKVALLGVLIVAGGALAPFAGSIRAKIGLLLRPRWVVEDKLELHGCTVCVLRNETGDGPLRAFEIRSKACVLFGMTGAWFQLEPPLDLTGDGVPDLHVVHDTMGCGLRHDTHYLFDLSNAPDYGILGPWATLGFGDFQDLDGDGRPEFVGDDYSFAYVWQGSGNSPVATVVLCLRDGAYRFAGDLMKKPPPPDSELATCAAEFRRDKDRPWSVRIAPVLQAMVDLIYSGNEPRAWQLLEEAWQTPEEVDRNEFIGQFKARLADSPYYRELQALPKGPE